MEASKNHKTIEPIETRVSQSADGVILLRIFDKDRKKVFLEAGQRLPIREYSEGIDTQVQVKDFLAILGFESWEKLEELDASYLGKYGTVLDFEVTVGDIPSNLEESFVNISDFGGGKDE